MEKVNIVYVNILALIETMSDFSPGEEHKDAQK